MAVGGAAWRDRAAAIRIGARRAGRLLPDNFFAGDEQTSIPPWWPEFCLRLRSAVMTQPHAGLASSRRAGGANWRRCSVRMAQTSSRFAAWLEPDDAGFGAICVRRPAEGRMAYAGRASRCNAADTGSTPVII